MLKISQTSQISLVLKEFWLDWEKNVCMNKNWLNTQIPSISKKHKPLHKQKLTEHKTPCKIKEFLLNKKTAMFTLTSWAQKLPSTSKNPAHQKIRTWPKFPGKHKAHFKNQRTIKIKETKTIALDKTSPVNSTKHSKHSKIHILNNLQKKTPIQKCISLVYSPKNQWNK